MAFLHVDIMLTDRTKGGIAVEDLNTLYDGLQHAEIRIERIDNDKVGGIALLQHTPFQMIVTLRIDTGSHQDFPYVVAISQSASHHQVDMPTHQVVGMTVVGTEHDHIGRLGNQRIEILKVLGSTTIANNHLHAGRDTGAPFFDGGTLMIG